MLNNTHFAAAEEAMSGICILLNHGLNAKVTVDTVTAEVGGQMGNYLYGIIKRIGTVGWVSTPHILLTFSQLEAVFADEKEEIEFITFEVDETDYPF